MKRSKAYLSKPLVAHSTLYSLMDDGMDIALGSIGKRGRVA
ncbi:MAG: hypothetical protein JWM21_4360 [Acidobacteria bacterium]|nr:hypothetical protein [Acidobacteriota bacterium]